jgi:MoxR-like ATPase
VPAALRGGRHGQLKRTLDIPAARGYRERRAAGVAQGELVGKNAQTEPFARPRHIVDRPRLTDLLGQATAPIVLLIGPPGFGKTTLARQWLAENSIDAVWYTATSSSMDPAVLAAIWAWVSADQAAAARFAWSKRRGEGPWTGTCT